MIRIYALLLSAILLSGCGSSVTGSGGGGTVGGVGGGATGGGGGGGGLQITQASLIGSWFNISSAGRPNQCPIGAACTTVTYNFSSNGTYRKIIENTLASSSGTTVPVTGQDGTWTVQGDTITFNPTDGSTAPYRAQVSAIATDSITLTSGYKYIKQ